MGTSSKSTSTLLIAFIQVISLQTLSAAGRGFLGNVDTKRVIEAVADGAADRKDLLLLM